MELVPILNNAGEIEDGHYIEALNFCKCHCGVGRCKDFYEKIKRGPLVTQFCTCPYGMSVYISAIDKRIYCSMREKSTYNKNQAKNIADVTQPYNPVLNAEQLLNLINAAQVIRLGKNALEEKSMMVEGVSHEVKKLNGQIFERSDLALSILNSVDEETGILSEDKETLIELIRTIYLSSSMIASRYAMFDYERNPSALARTQFDCCIYKKFDKLNRIFWHYQKRNIPIRLTGNSYKCINAYTSFELIPLLIIENAVKYAYNTTEVLIHFEETSDTTLEVTVNSYSPYCSQEELTHLFEKGFRGKNAGRVADGNGIGLYFVKILCDLHNIDLRVQSDRTRIADINGIAYAPFKVILTIPETYDAP